MWKLIVAGALFFISTIALIAFFIWKEQTSLREYKIMKHINDCTLVTDTKDKVCQYIDDRKNIQFLPLARDVDPNSLVGKSHYEQISNQIHHFGMAHHYRVVYIIYAVILLVCVILVFWELRAPRVDVIVASP